MSVLAWAARRMQIARDPTAPTDGNAARLIAIGLDFGTSSIKVALRDLTDSKAPVTLVDFGTTLSGYSRFVVPSTVIVSQQRMLTGVEAETAATEISGTVLRSGKVNLLRGTWSPLDEHLSLPLPDHTTPRATQTEFACTILLAGVLRQVLDLVQKQWGNTARILCNIDVPVDHLENNVAASAFGRMLNVSLRLAETGAEWSSLREAHAAWRSACDAFRTSPDARTAIVAEAQAILAGISDIVQPQEHKPYAVVDIGAGTTDIGIFRLSMWDSDERINFFASGTCIIGCDDVDAIVCEQLGVPLLDGAAVKRALRASRASADGGKPIVLDLDDGRHILQAADLHRAVRQVAHRCNQHFIKMCCAARNKARRHENWREIPTIVVGGGALMPGLGDMVRQVPPSLRSIFTKTPLLPLKSLAQCSVIGASKRAPEPDELVFLTAAIGLAYAPVQMKKLVTPVEVEEIPDRSDRPTGIYDVDADEYYAK